MNNSCMQEKPSSSTPSLAVVQGMFFNKKLKLPLKTFSDIIVVRFITFLIKKV